MGKVVSTCLVALALLGPSVAAAGASGALRNESREGADRGAAAFAQGFGGPTKVNERSRGAPGSGMNQQPRDPGRAPVAAKGRLLDVPFVPQSEALCGGAAAAMVFRYWRASPAYPEEFASLVDDSVEGIKLGALTRAIQDRGWRAVSFAGTASDIQQHLAQGRPIIALIEDRPGRHHYVVVVAWTTDQMVFHDPARGPFRVIDQQKFERAWAATSRTALLILPARGPQRGSRVGVEELDPVFGSSADPEPLDTASGHCAEPLQEAVQLARGGDLDAAEALLSLVAEACPGFAGALRELAGIRVLQKRWSEAAALAEQAIGRDPSDMHAWQLLASARFLWGDTDGALRAWNRRNEPRVDLARIEGLGRTHHRIVSDLLSLPPQTLLTANHLERARRRIAELPALQVSRVSYSPRANGLATVDVAMLERSLLPNSWPSVGAVGLHTATDREIRVDVASPTGNGELWTATWRWWANRPRVSLSVATPQVGRWTGLWRVDGAWERQTYRVVSSQATGESSGETLIASDRRRAAVKFGDWRSGSFRWEVGGTLENWNNRGNYLSAAAAIERRLREDRLAVRLEGALWESTGHAGGFGSSAISSAWRSNREGSTAWTVGAGLHLVSERAPFDVWPAADTGHVRAVLLRAHPLLDAGAIRASALGRVLAHTTLEFQRDLTTHPFLNGAGPHPRDGAPWYLRAPFGHLRWAAFVDVVKQGKTHSSATSPTQIDVGAGLRARLPGAPGVLRVDVARGMRDGSSALSAAWQSAWPGW